MEELELCVRRANAFVKMVAHEEEGEWRSEANAM